MEGYLHEEIRTLDRLGRPTDELITVELVAVADGAANLTITGLARPTATTRIDAKTCRELADVLNRAADKLEGFSL